MDGHAGGGGQEHCPRRSPAPPSGLSGSSAPPPVRGLCRQQVASRLPGFQASRQWVLGPCPGSELSARVGGEGHRASWSLPSGDSPRGHTAHWRASDTPSPTGSNAWTCHTVRDHRVQVMGGPAVPSRGTRSAQSWLLGWGSTRVLASFFSLKWIVGGGPLSLRGGQEFSEGRSVRCPIGPCRNRTPPAPLRSGRTLSPCLTPTPWPTGHAGGGERGSRGSPRPLPAEIGTLGQKRWTLPCGGKRTGRHGRGKRA